MGWGYVEDAYGLGANGAPMPRSGGTIGIGPALEEEDGGIPPNLGMCLGAVTAAVEGVRGRAGVGSEVGGRAMGRRDDVAGYGAEAALVLGPELVCAGICDWVWA